MLLQNNLETFIKRPNVSRIGINEIWKKKIYIYSWFKNNLKATIKIKNNLKIINVFRFFIKNNRNNRKHHFSSDFNDILKQYNNNININE